MFMMMIIMRRRRKGKTGLGLLQSTRLQEATSSRPTDTAGRISDFVLKLFVRNFSHCTYIVNSGLCIGGGLKFIFTLGPVISQIGPNDDKDDNDDHDDDNNNNNNNKVVAKCG
jgi:hypothetical protein